MPDSPVISRKPPAAPALNYAALRDAGIRYLEKVVGQLWTDYNAHDPGITLLELLCYGITDVTYRTTFPDADLFAPAPGETVPGPHQPPLVTARFALTNAPVTPADYRRLVLDRFPELRNVWVDPATQTLFANRRTRKLTAKPGPATVPFPIRGLHRFRLLFHDHVPAPRQTEVLREVTRLYYQYRNLSEDLAAVEVTPLEDVIVCAEIQLLPDAAVEETHARVVHALRAFLSPVIPRHSLADLVARGLSPEEIFDGPPLDHGFILESELDAAGPHEALHASDLIAAILAVPGVRAVTRFQMNRPPQDQQSFPPVEWELPISPGHHPRLSLEHARLSFAKGPLPFHSDLAVVQQRLSQLEAEAAAAAVAPGPFDLPIPEGVWRDLADFTTLQSSLPLYYGVGRRGFDATVSEERKAAARQLQAFLLIFDQALANYLGQLTHVRPLFSTDPELRRSYFTRAVADLPDLHALLNPVAGNPNATPDQVLTEYEKLFETATAKHDPWVQRRSRILDHLLARFAESFTDHVLTHYTATGLRPPESALEAKRAFLAEQPRLASERLQAHDLLDPDGVWDTPNVSGFEQRLGRLLGFASSDRRSLSTIVYEFYEETDADTASETRFRIIDTRTRKTVLSGTRRFATRDAASAEMRLAIQLAMQASNYRLKVAQDGQHFFVLVNVVDGTEDSVAIRKERWATRAEAEAERDRVVALVAQQYSEEGLFLIENLLLRPREKPAEWPLLPAPCTCTETPAGTEACATTPAGWDPYSFRVHLVFPGYTDRLADPGFRRLVESILRRELPAHLLPKICFVDRDQLGELELHYRAWLESLAADKPNPKVLTKLITTLNHLHTIYPPGALHDCKEDGDEAAAIVLNQSRLGTLPAPPPTPPVNPGTDAPTPP